MSEKFPPERLLDKLTRIDELLTMLIKRLDKLIELATPKPAEEVPAPEIPPIIPAPRVEFPEALVTIPYKARILSIGVFNISPDEDFKYSVGGDGVTVLCVDDDIWFNIMDTTESVNNFPIPAGTIYTIFPSKVNKVLHFKSASKSTKLYIIDFKVET